MRIILVVTIAVAIAAAAGLIGRSAHAGVTSAQLRLTGTQPFSVRGVGFRKAERVSVVLRLATGTTWTQATTASRSSGAFNAVFTAAKVGHCTGFSVRATGRAGSTAVLRRVPLPACSPA